MVWQWRDSAPPVAVWEKHRLYNKQRYFTLKLSHVVFRSTIRLCTEVFVKAKSYVNKVHIVHVSSLLISAPRAIVICQKYSRITVISSQILLLSIDLCLYILTGIRSTFNFIIHVNRDLAERLKRWTCKLFSLPCEVSNPTMNKTFCNFHLFCVPRSWIGSGQMKSSMAFIRGNRYKERDNDNFKNGGEVKC